MLSGEKLYTCYQLLTLTYLDLQIISNDISELQKNQATTVAKIAQYKRKLMDLSHRVLQVAASPFSLC